MALSKPQAEILSKLPKEQLLDFSAVVLSTIFANGEYDIQQIDESRFRLRVTSRHQQVRRVEEGLGELPCKPAGMAICEAAAGAINPAIRVKCLVYPPDAHLADVWCEWEFELAG